ncbi:methyltransferase domain-containing protein [archaeon]|jgi:tRNA (adenine57-N1/adenine58-N1)-methyltransferase catalytic subunit|nr:methyltransferase domain-containing protein [archaeon]MBT3450454.1 methyltransferase domain-containing protein [archaeon]MBT6868989.1 methyltransferase domain-containing protein [archaeon]MBT7193255.1 methyltransferase domain-containing protein [archaeon]MBT7380110.1 methyltransferase domain-containing protein [archaeon]
MVKDKSVKKILISAKGKKKYYVTQLNEDFITTEGVVKSLDLSSEKEFIETDKGNKFHLINPSIIDLMEKLNRGPQIIQPKDIGLIMSKTGINKNSLVVDAGVGSGTLSLALANICKQVTAYEINNKHLNIAQKNKELFGAENLEIKKGDVAEEMTETNLDLITLDLPHPWEVVPKAELALKLGSYLVVYLPNILQMKKFVESLKGSKIKLLEVIELIERKWKVEERIVRPETAELSHTAFMAFCRKM